MAICPECRDGKHSNCDGSAWDHRQDSETVCICVCDAGMNPGAAK